MTYPKKTEEVKSLISQVMDLLWQIAQIHETEARVDDAIAVYKMMSQSGSEVAINQLCELARNKKTEIKWDEAAELYQFIAMCSLQEKKIEACEMLLSIIYAYRQDDKAIKNYQFIAEHGDDDQRAIGLGQIFGKAEGYERQCFSPMEHNPSRQVGIMKIQRLYLDVCFEEGTSHKKNFLEALNLYQWILMTGPEKNAYFDKARECSLNMLHEYGEYAKSNDFPVIEKGYRILVKYSKDAATKQMAIEQLMSLLTFYKEMNKEKEAKNIETFLNKEDECLSQRGKMPEGQERGNLGTLKSSALPKKITFFLPVNIQDTTKEIINCRTNGRTPS